MEKGIQEGSLSEMEGRVEGSKRSWRGFLGKGGGVGRGTFIHSSSFIFSPLVVVVCRFEVEWGGGVHGGTQCGSVQ